jgi:hypothetical protein
MLYVDARNWVMFIVVATSDLATVSVVSVSEWVVFHLVPVIDWVTVES